MRKFLAIVLCGATIFCQPVHAFRRDGEKTKPVYVDKGDLFERFASTVGITTPVQIFSTVTYPSGVRAIQVCNPTSFQLFVGTFSTVSGSTTAVVNAREYIPINSCKDIWPVVGQSLWAIFESASVTIKLITGGIHRDSSD
mgnify:CR=1 FL=1